MREYDLIAIGTGSAMNFMEVLLDRDPEMRIAVIDKDDPGGICLTRGCIPTKLLLYPAEVLRMLEGVEELGIDVDVKRIDFRGIMERMASIIQGDIAAIREGLAESKNIDYYHGVAEFVGPYELQVGGHRIRSDMIFLGTGSRPLVPSLNGLDQVAYHTSDTILNIREVPASLAILGGGYIAAEYGHFFSAMGSEVSIIGRNPRFLPQEEPEISDLAKRKMSRHMRILTGHEVVEVAQTVSGEKEIVAREGATGELKRLNSDEILVAVGRASNTDLLRPDKSGIETDAGGWVKVNGYLETTARNIWAFGDANGRHLFKHVANYESRVVFYNAILKEKVRVDYRAVPHAVFCHPEIAAVGMGEKDAIETYGEDRILIGFHRYQDTAKGEAMGLRDYFVKVVVEEELGTILGAHIIGPQASVLIQEIINLMYTEEGTFEAIMTGMHIHPALSEVVQRAFMSLMPPHHYRHVYVEEMMS